MNITKILARWAVPALVSLAVNAALFAVACWKVHKAFGWMMED